MIVHDVRGPLVFALLPFLLPCFSVSRLHFLFLLACFSACLLACLFAVLFLKSLCCQVWIISLFFHPFYFRFRFLFPLLPFPLSPHTSPYHQQCILGWWKVDAEGSRTEPGCLRFDVLKVYLFKKIRVYRKKQKSKEKGKRAIKRFEQTINSVAIWFLHFLFLM